MSEIELSVVVLCYRAEELAERFVPRLEREVEQLGVTYELVLVANYDAESRDRTPEIVRRVARDKPCMIVEAKQKKGRMGWDMRSGLEQASGKYILVIDGDGQMLVSDISTVYAIIKTGRYDLVKTFREKRFDGPYRATLSSVYNLLFKLMFHPGFSLNDINSKPKIMTREACRKMNLRQGH